MMPRTIRTSTTMAAILLELATAAWCGTPERVVLDGAAIVTDPDPPSFVRHALEDLAGYLRETTGSEVPIGASPEVKAPALIAVGPKAARRILGDALLLEDLGEEGFLLRTASRDGVNRVVAAGATPLGTHAALAALMKAIEFDGKSAFLPAPLDLRRKPAFAKRGMHFNGWPFRHPYTFRSWRAEDWQRYLDILAYQGVNLFYLWPFMEILPIPLSPEDREYLEECRRVVDYAHEAHGMEVWIMQCTNRVARDRCGVPDPRLRPYWRPSQEDLDPGDPQHLQAILSSREALYRAVNNVDGVCNIDSDPGYYRGSPLEDYIKVLRGCRDLLDRHNIHGRRAKLVNWMWCGWGLPPERAFEPAHQALTLKLLRENLAEPWEVVSGRFEFLSSCQKEGVLGKTILLPYGLIEDEPSYPSTNLRIDGIRAELAAHLDPDPGLLGVMGNVQTPLLQLPHMYFFTSWIGDPEYRKRSERDVLLDLSRHLYPEHGPLLADCYLALRELDPARIDGPAGRLDGVLREDRLGRLGVIGRKLFPDHRIVAKVLLLQLRLRAAQERLAMTAASSSTECAGLVRDLLDAYLAWDTAHGWHELWGWQSWPLGNFTTDPRFPALAGRLRKCFGDETAVNARFDEIARDLSTRYGAGIVREGAIAPLRQAVLAAMPIVSLAQKARATASVVPDPARYPPGAANDGLLSTLYWPGALVEDNVEWLQLTWDEPLTFETVIVRFLRHPSMTGRTIHLEREVRPGVWEDIATTVIPADPAAPHAVATFRLPSRRTLEKIRIVNLLDLFEIEVR